MRLKVINTGSTGNAYLLYNEQEALLIEAGVLMPDIKKAIDFNFSKLSGCIVTHEHNDHAKSMLSIMRKGVNVYASRGTLSAHGLLDEHRAFVIEQRVKTQIAKFDILPFSIQHDAIEPLGFLIQHEECGKVLFLTDTFYCKYTFPGINNILIEANYDKKIIDKRFGADSPMEFLRNRVLKSHFSIDNCVDMLKANDLSKTNNIVLIHLSEGNSNEKDFIDRVEKATGKNVFVASKGLDIPFNKSPF